MTTLLSDETFREFATILFDESLSSEDDSEDSTICGASGAARTEVVVFRSTSGSELFNVAVALVDSSTIRLSSSPMDDEEDSEESLSSNQCFDSLGLLIASLNVFSKDSHAGVAFE